MIWSFSAHSTFRKCARQWYYKRVFANSRAKDPLRQEAARLFKLESIPAWRGKIVDTVISDTIIPSIVWKRPCSLSMAKVKANQLFDAQRVQRSAGNTLESFFETEYGIAPNNETFEKARTEVHTALENFFKAETLWTLLQQANTLVPQRPLSFKQGSVSVRVVPDLIVFQTSSAPRVIDWKVNAYPLRDYWLQLVTGAIGVTRCNPHRDWPAGATSHATHEVELLEVQLLTGDIRAHNITEHDVREAEDFIAISACQMELACGDDNIKGLSPEDLPVAYNPETCQRCPVRKLCWRNGA